MATELRRGLEMQPSLRSRIVVSAALALCVAVAFAPLLGAGWVYDDVNLVQPSPALTDLAGLVRSISTDLYSQAAPRLEVSPYWRPLAMASYWLDTRFGAAPRALHVGNILLHALATALLMLVIMRRHDSRAGVIAAVLASAWWALHPENVEPVAWISCRYDLLCGLALLGFLALPWRPGPLRAALFGLVFLAGLLSKEGFGMMAVVVVAIDFAERRPVRAAAPRWVAVVLALLIWISLRAAIKLKSFDLPPPTAIFSILRNYVEAIAIYTWRALASPALTISHPYTPGGVLQVLAGVLILAALTVASLLRRRLAVPAVIFLAGLIPMAGAMTMFHEVPERYLYVPSIGLALLVGELVAFALSVRHRFVRILIPAVVGVVMVLGLIQLEQRLPDWESDDTLWTDAFRVDREDPLANHYLAVSAGKRSDWSRALKYIQVAANGNPDSGRFATTYAWVLLNTDDPAGAAREAERAILLTPYQPDSWFYLAFARHTLGDHAGELSALEQLLQIAPDFPGAREAYEAAVCEARGQTNCG